jgi:SsrA-binding protein
MAKKGKRKVAPGDVASNRQARFRYELLDTLEAGIVLQGTEVKALRTEGGQMTDAYAAVSEGEVWLHNLHIPPYKPAAQDNHQPDRSRKLLLHRREIDRLLGRVRERGLTVVPTRIYFRNGHAKVELALARGKDVHDKRDSIRERETKREMERAMGARRR